MRLIATTLIIAAAAALAPSAGFAKAAKKEAAAAPAEGRVKLGTLECKGGQNIGMIVGSSTTLTCEYTGPENKFKDSYTATVKKIGLDLGITESTQVAWTVFAPTSKIGKGDLAGSYAGVSGSATVGVGVGANALIGGSNNSFALQPLSLQGQTGISVQGGFQSLELTPVADKPMQRKKH